MLLFLNKFQTHFKGSSMKYYSHLANLCLIFLAISCAQEKVPDVKSVKLDNTGVEKPTKLEALRTNFVNEQLEPMKFLVNQSLDVYTSFQTLATNLQNKEGEDSEKFNKLDNEFSKKYGKRGLVIKKELAELSETFQKTRSELLVSRSKIEREQPTHKKNVAAYNKCKKELTTGKARLEKDIKAAQKAYKRSIKDVPGLLALVKSKKAGVARNKKRANRSNWPSDKKKYKKKAKKLAKQANGHAKKAKQINDSAKKTFNGKVAGYKKRANKLKKSVIACEKDGKIAQKSAENLKKSSTAFTVQKKTLIETKNKIEQVKGDNKIFFEAYNKYIQERQSLTDEAQLRLDQLAHEYNSLEEMLLTQYGQNYYDTLQKLILWIKQDRIDGDESLELIKELQNISQKTTHISPIIIEMIKIIEEAKNKVAWIGTSNSRKVASVISNITGIDINISDIKIIDVKVPKVVDIKIDGLDIDIRDLEIKIPKLDVEIPNVDLADVDVQDVITDIVSIEVNVPELSIINISADINGDITKMGANLSKIEIEVPQLKIVHLSTDTGKDLTQIKRNIDRELTKSKKDLDRELTSAYKNIKRETDDGIKSTGKTLGDAVKELRDSIMNMQGVDIDKTLRLLRDQIKVCRTDKANLSAATVEFTELNKAIIDLRNSGNVSYKEVNDFAQKRLDKIETFKVGNGQVAGASLMVTSIGLTLGAEMGSFAAYGGAWGVLAAAAIHAMSEQATEEIEHEAHKLAECGKKYENVFLDFQSEYYKYVEYIEKGEKAEEKISISKNYSELTDLILDAELDMDENIETEIEKLRYYIIEQILDYRVKFNEMNNENLNSMLSELKEMEAL
jgi:hypothetical protein